MHSWQSIEFIHSIQYHCNHCPARLLPPWLKTSTEVSLGPWREGHHVLCDVAVGKGKGEWSWSTHHLTLVIVLGSVAWAHELVLCGVPWNDASQVGAHSVQSILFNLSLSGDYEVGGITLETLSQTAVSWLVGLQPFGFLRGKQYAPG